VWPPKVALLVMVLVVTADIRREALALAFERELAPFDFGVEILARGLEACCGKALTCLRLGPVRKPATSSERRRPSLGRPRLPAIPWW
jgi:hypothetical protein